MTVKEVIGILSAVDPDSEVRMTLGRDKVYREACAPVADPVSQVNNFCYV